MKKLFFILFVLFVSCNTNEEKITKSFNNIRGTVSSSFKVNKVIIYDTIYAYETSHVIGYYTKIIVNKDTLDFVVSPKFYILCPTSMYKK